MRDPGVRKGIPNRTQRRTAERRSRPRPAASHIAGTNCFSLNPRYSLHSDHVRGPDTRCSTDERELPAQHDRLRELGVSEKRIYLDHGLTGANRKRPGLGQALAAVREGDTLVVPKLDRLARSVPDARDIGDSLADRGIKLSLGGQIYDPTDPMGKMFFNILATFAEFEVDLLRWLERRAEPARLPHLDHSSRTHLYDRPHAVPRMTAGAREPGPGLAASSGRGGRPGRGPGRAGSRCGTRPTGRRPDARRRG
jgi:hypothetical protein